MNSVRPSCLYLCGVTCSKGYRTLHLLIPFCWNLVCTEPVFFVKGLTNSYDPFELKRRFCFSAQYCRVPSVLLLVRCGCWQTQDTLQAQGIVKFGRRIKMWLSDFQCSLRLCWIVLGARTLLGLGALWKSTL